MNLATEKAALISEWQILACENLDICARLGKFPFIFGKLKYSEGKTKQNKKVYKMSNV